MIWSLLLQANTTMKMTLLQWNSTPFFLVLVWHCTFAQEWNSWHKPEKFGSRIPRLLSLAGLWFWGHLHSLSEHKGDVIGNNKTWKKLGHDPSPGTSWRVMAQTYSSHLPLITPWNRLMLSHNQTHFAYQESLWTINYWGSSSLTSFPHPLNRPDPPP